MDESDTMNLCQCNNVFMFFVSEGPETNSYTILYAITPIRSKQDWTWTKNISVPMIYYAWFSIFWTVDIIVLHFKINMRAILRQPAFYIKIKVKVKINIYHIAILPFLPAKDWR